MNLLLVSATLPEISPAIEYLNKHWQKKSDTQYIYAGFSVDICLTGVGMLAAAYHIATALQCKTYDFALQCGIAGAFSKGFHLGNVVAVSGEQIGDLGAEDHDNFLDVYSLGLASANAFPYLGGILPAQHSTYSGLITLPQVKGLTVNTVSGSQSTISVRTEKYKPDVESMEGAAFHYCCLLHNLPFAQIRAISNYVEPRNRDNWQIGLAISNLNDWLKNFLSNITEKSF